MRYCVDFENKPGFPGCCDMCHDVHDEFGDDLCGGYDLLDDCEVCCRVAT
jgi:hypothetical protein